VSYQKNLKIGRMCDLVLPIFGVHPWNAPGHVDHLDDLKEAIDRSPILGEIGLDYHFVKDTSQYPAQRRVFEFFLAEASKQDKIVNLHTKGAEKDVLQLLEQYDIKKALIHWYSGPFDIFRELAARGAYFTVNTAVLQSEHIRKIAREISSDHLLTETDSPGGPRMSTGEAGTPVQVKEVVKALADLRHTVVEDIIQTVQRNFQRLIQGDPRLSSVYHLLSD
ncbi:MAG: TatD family hydrolase, partial [Deltaproteobacteria bacterium]|nr:TatD family hydrolase [Deltaproteobacteria bacterium]